jgi:pyrimidine-nucleoside phosphorylase
LYALRDVTGTVESIPLITASILSKKIAEGIDSLVMDVKCGRGAFMKTRADAHKLAESLVTIGTANGVETEAFLTDMDAPLGRAVGHSLEVIECVEVLKGEGPDDLRELSLALAAAMLRMGGLCHSSGEADAKLRSALGSGRGLEKFREIIANQAGDPRVLDEYDRLPAARRQALLRAPRSGYVGGINSELIGRATLVLGAGRDRVEDHIDHGVGVVLHVRRGDAVREGDPLLEVHYRDESHLRSAWPLLEYAYHFDDAPPDVPPLILDTIP